MSITFYVTDLDTRIQSAPAKISPRELARFRSFMREVGVETDDDLNAEPEQLTYAFHASICRFALASLAQIFSSRIEVIAVIEEAQFLGRLLSFQRDTCAHTISIEVSQRIDGPVEIDLANGSAYAVLEALGIEPESVGDILLEDLRERLANPLVRRAFYDRCVEHRLRYLDTLAALNPHEQTPRLVWA